MKKKNIAFVISSLTAGGAERVVSTLSNELVHDFNITIIVFYKCKPFYALDPAINLVFCKQEYKSKINKVKSLLNHFQLINCIFKNLKRNDIDVSIGFMTTTNIYTIIASRMAKIPSVISERIHPSHSKLVSAWVKLRSLIYPKASKIVVQTEGIKSYFTSFIPNDKIAIIKNPLATNFIVDSSVVKEKIVLNVGRLNFQKNQELLINAFSNVNNNDWKLIIIGKGSRLREHQKLIKELGMEHKVEIINNVTNMSAFYNKASIFASTSDYEGFPNALTEAMHFGLPCIATDCPSGPSELIKDGENGFLIPIKNQVELQKKLELLMSNINLRNKLSDKALVSTAQFGVDVIAQQWKDLINNLKS